MSAAQLKTEVLVQAGFRYCQQALLFAALRRRGDADAGALLVKVSRLDGTAAVFARTQSLEGELAWRRATGEGWIPEEEAEARLARGDRLRPGRLDRRSRGPRGPQPLRDAERLSGSPALPERVRQRRTRCRSFRDFAGIERDNDRRPTRQPNEVPAIQRTGPQARSARLRPFPISSCPD